MNWPRCICTSWPLCTQGCFVHIFFFVVLASNVSILCPHPRLVGNGVRESMDIMTAMLQRAIDHAVTVLSNLRRNTSAFKTFQAFELKLAQQLI